jgi:formylglycine-generating enzyme required for sulfatase activity
MNYLIDAGELLADSKGIRARTGRLLVLSLINDDPYYHQFGIRFVDNHVAPMAGREDHPVVGVKWFGALVFCNGLSKMEGLAQTYQITGEKAKPGLDKHANGYRLPTEAEWEYAARGGNRRNIFAWGDTVDSSVANYNGSINPFTGTSSMPWENGGPTTPVGYFNGEAHGTFTTRSNECPFGLYDMGGNVAQWCWDTYLESYYSTSPEVDPQGPPKEAILHSVPWVVTRGGGWQSYPGQLRVYFRQKASPFANDFTIGFRVAKSLAP